MRPWGRQIHPTALDLIANGSLDGAILDVSIGSGDSTAVADALRQKGVPYALATGRAGGKLVAEYGKAPSLLKPYDFADVRGVMAQILGPHSGALEALPRSATLALSA